MRLKRICDFADEAGWTRFEMAGLVSFMAAAVWTSLAFLFGVSVSGVSFWLAIVLGGVLAAMRSRVNLACYIALMCVTWLATAFSFSYVMIDPATCHFPMAQALVEGWNPLLEGTPEGFSRYISEECAVEWILAAPKLNSVVSAIVSKGTGLFTAALFLQYLVFFAAIPCAMRFAASVLGLKRYWAFFFALATLLPFCTLQRLFCGFVDWIKMVATLAMLFSAFVWWRGGSKRDLASFVLMSLVAVASKTQALGIAIVAGIIVFAKAKSMRLAFSTALIGVILTASPFLSQWLRGGSPFYPAHSFLPYVETLDLTRDFTDPQHFNADFLSMGRAARVCRAWFSENLADAATRLWRRNDDFKPVANGIALSGFGRYFRIWMILSLLALPFCRKNRQALLFAGIIFFMCNIAMPVKYIGYGRYFLEMQTIPVIILLAAAQNAKIPRVCAQFAIAAVALFLTCKAGKAYLNNLQSEAIRQNAYAMIKATGGTFKQGDIQKPKFAACISTRMRAAGLDVADTADSVPVDFRNLNPWSQDMIPVTTIEQKAAYLPRLLMQSY